MHFKKLYIKNPSNLGVSQSASKKPEKAQLEAKAEIKPSIKDRLFRRAKPIVVEPEIEEKVLIDEKELQPVVHNVDEHEIIVPKVMEKRVVPVNRSINPERRNTGVFRLHDEITTPMLTPMVAPMQMQGY